uniref:U-box domain-containing protein n=1 Tax=Entomoneis paludosa TaxID=265537 RepID=A0A7S3DNA2_9STRA|eukprot:CAMPEP_0172466540 /NCGR_PEP_ID=MMETSP1065-20121228/56445_1 /TAXON_ID=265537 /ORGANISM="Amphiprora paludosa, Strain CCMP125" /LENGTH=181 /DNA_ID=CAMNT_0013223369 /DNA_START=30 /DNA_END=575 /DNA_ORIENTATION=+
MVSNPSKQAQSARMRDDETESTTSVHTVEIPQEYICPITMEIMSHPLCNRAGNNFERRAILNWLERHGTNPLTRKEMKPSDLIPNRHLEGQIRFFLLENGLVNNDMAPYGREQEHDDNKKSQDFRGFIPTSDIESYPSKSMHKRSRRESVRTSVLLEASESKTRRILWAALRKKSGIQKKG